MRSLVSRLKRLEQAQRMRVGPRRIRIEPGYLKTLPSDYVGPRHQITVRQIPPEELPPAHRAENWFEWEERPGPGPVSDSRNARTNQWSGSNMWNRCCARKVSSTCAGSEHDGETARHHRRR